MSENVGNTQRQYRLNAGFSVSRFVVGNELEKLAHELDGINQKDAAVEIRWPHAETDDDNMIDARLATKILKQRDIRVLPLPHKNVPLQTLYKDLAKTIPELDEPIVDGVELIEIYETRPDKDGGRFIVAGFDDLTNDRLTYERLLILKRVMAVGGLEGRRPRLFTPDTTLAFIGGHALEGSAESVIDIAREHLPIPAEIEPVVKYPQINL